MAYRAAFSDKREFGVELEGYGLSRLETVELLGSVKVGAYVNDNFSTNSEKWTVATDGTIKQKSPLEIISPRLRGLKGLEEVRKVCAVLQKGGLKTDESCGLHIHWDVSDYTGHSMVNLLKLYAKYEKILDYFFDPSRRGDENNHARSLIKPHKPDWIYALNRPFFYRADQIAQEFEKTQTLDPVTSFPSARHHKINLCSFNKYGTVEFRQHQGTFDWMAVENWIVFTQQLVNRSKDSTVNEGIATLESLMRTLGLTDQQLNLWEDLPDKRIESPRKDLLIRSRDYYKKIYRENKRENEAVHELQVASR